MTLADVPVGKTAIIKSIEFDELFCTRCFALGLRCGVEVTVLRIAPLGGPMHVRLGTTELVLRKTLASLIKVL